MDGARIIISWRGHSIPPLHILAGHAQGGEHTLPSAVVASECSRSTTRSSPSPRGNVIWVKDDYLERGLHPDLLRYYLASYTAHNKEVNCPGGYSQTR